MENAQYQRVGKRAKIEMRRPIFESERKVRNQRSKLVESRELARSRVNYDELFVNISYMDQQGEKLENHCAEEGG